MKFVKFGIFTLALGMFVASCGNGENTEETPAEDTAAMTEMAPAVEETPAPVVDTTVAPAADTTAAPAPAAH